MCNSHFRGNLFKTVFTTLLCGIVASTLITTNLFIYASLTPFYLFLLITSIAIFLTGLLLIFKPIKINVSWPVVIAIIWIIYILSNGFLEQNFNPFHSYLIVSLVFLIGLSLYFQVVRLKTDALIKAIIVLSALEALFCIGQFVGLIHTYNNYFPVTGSWENPNVTAMFLGMTIPAVIQLIIEEKRFFKIVAIAGLSLIIIALTLLKCRTALIGVVVAAAIVLNNRYKMIGWLLSKRNRSGSLIIILLCVSLLVPLIGYVYNAKKASADGRKLIWKLSTEMIMDKPVYGYGYGLFEKNYNLFQAKYFAEGNGTSEEIQQAGFVNMGYNEFLENAVEGGLPGVLLLGGLFLSLLLIPSSKEIRSLTHKTDSYFVVAYAGVATFVVMSLCNFTIQAIPSMCLFIIYAAILCSHLSLGKLPDNKPDSRSHLGYGFPLGLSIVFLGLFMVYKNVIAAYASLINNRAAIEMKHGNVQPAIQMLIPLASNLNAYESYWTNFANTRMAEKDYHAAIALFTKAKDYTSTPNVFIKTANCYFKIGDYRNAERNYLIAHYIEPSHLAPQFALMNTYLKEKDTAKAVGSAHEIINQKLKIASKEADYYKYQAKLLLNKLGINIAQQPLVKLPVFLHKSL